MAEMQTHRPDGMKFAVTCENRGDMLELLAFARDLAAATPDGCALSMGAAGTRQPRAGTRARLPVHIRLPDRRGGGPGTDFRARAEGLLRRDSQARSGTPAGTTDMDDSELMEWAEARIAGETLAD